MIGLLHDRTSTRALILLKTWRYISRLLTYLLTYLYLQCQAGTAVLHLSSEVDC